ncbi:MAG: hypothetical protein ACPGGD_07025 [Thalassolituus sp.]
MRKDKDSQIQGSDELIKQVSEKMRDLTRYAKSVLHLSFTDLDALDPDFTVIARICELNVALFHSMHRKGQIKEAIFNRMREITKIMQDISEGVINRDDQALVDAMCEIDEFFRINNEKE